VRGLAVLLATGLGVGRLPVAPATWASAVTAVFLYFLLPRMDHLAYIVLTVGITALALVVCGPAEKVLGHDAHPIVADEVYHIAHEAVRNARTHARASKSRIAVMVMMRFTNCPLGPT